MLRMTRRRIVAGIAVFGITVSAASAHHGWSWTDEEKFELTGTIQEVFIGNPHAVLKVEAEDGLWTVELAPPSPHARVRLRRERRQGIGDQVTAIGNRSSDHAEKRMKAVQLVVNGKTYDIYPDRIGSLSWRTRCRRSSPNGCRRWPPSAGRRASCAIRPSAYATLNALHIFSIGAGGRLDRDARPARARALPRACRLRRSPIRCRASPRPACCCAVATGFLLFSVRPLAYAQNPAFLTKITLVALGVANALVLRANRGWRVALESASRRTLGPRSPPSCSLADLGRRGAGRALDRLSAVA